MQQVAEGQDHLVLQGADAATNGEFWLGVVLLCLSSFRSKANVHFNVCPSSLLSLFTIYYLAHSQ